MEPAVHGLLALVSLLAGCGELGGVTTGKMYAGADCLACHAAGGLAAERPLTLAGSVFPSPQAGADEGMGGVEVAVTDAAGHTVTLSSNEVGNFFTDEQLAFPLSVEVRWNGAVARMSLPVPSGSCNACHALPPMGGATGRVFVP